MKSQALKERKNQRQLEKENLIKFLIDEKLSSTNGKLSNREAMQLLSDCSQDAHKNNQGKISKTQWSCVYDLKNKKVTVCVNQNYDAKYTISVLE